MWARGPQQPGIDVAGVLARAGRTRQMHLVETGEQEGAGLGQELIPDLLAHVLPEVTQRHHDLNRVAAGDALEHVDHPGAGLVGNRLERAVPVVVRGGTGEHDTPAYGSHQRPDRLDPSLVGRIPHPGGRVPEPLALGHREPVVHRIGEAHREQAERQRGPVHTRLPTVPHLSHAPGCRRPGDRGTPNVTLLAFGHDIRPV